MARKARKTEHHGPKLGFRLLLGAQEGGEARFKQEAPPRSGV
jgi:hypothetical protein